MSTRTPLITGNWKMHKTGAEAKESANQLKALIAGTSGVEVMFARVYTALYQVTQVLKETPIRLAAQNLHWETKGAFTGEVAADMLCDPGCSHVIPYLGGYDLKKYSTFFNLFLALYSTLNLHQIYLYGYLDIQIDEYSAVVGGLF